MIITMKISSIIEPRRGEINATPAGLVERWYSDFYNLFTPSGLGYALIVNFYDLFNPAGLGNRSLTHFYKHCNTLGLKS